MPAKTLMLLRFNVAPEKEHELNKWYDKVHLPSIVACPGFRSGRRFKVIPLATKPKGVSVGTEAKYMTLYELDSPAAYETKEFAKARGFFEFAPYLSDLTFEIFEEITCIEKSDV